MPSRLITDLDPRLQPFVPRLIADAGSAGYRVFVDCTYRSSAEQLIEWQKGRDTHNNIIDLHSVVTYAMPGQSAHECTLADGTPASLAFDIALYASAGGFALDWKAGDLAWKTVQQIGRSYLDDAGNPALELGADWPRPKTDGPHFELANWKSLRHQPASA